MRDPRLSYFYFFHQKSVKIKKKIFMSANVAFSLKISVKTKKKVFVVRDEASHFLRGSPFSSKP